MSVAHQAILLYFVWRFLRRPDLSSGNPPDAAYHYLHQRLVIDGFVRSEEDGGSFLPSVNAFNAVIIVSSVTDRYR